MRDVPSDDDDLPDIRPEDPEEQQFYLQRFRGRYAKEIEAVDPVQIAELVRNTLKLCPPLRIKQPRDVLRFLALKILVTPVQKPSQLLTTVTQRVLEALDDWSATKRLDFIDKHVVGRPTPVPEPDFGPWYVDITSPI